MKENEKRNSFWKPFLLWLVAFVFAQVICGVTARILIENGILNASDRVDPFRTSLAISTVCLVLFSFIGILAGKGKPFIVSSMLVTCATSMNPPGTLIFYLLILAFAVFIKWAFQKAKLLIGYYSPNES